MSIIQTERLNIRLASNDEMRDIIAAQTDAELKKAYGEMLDMCVKYPEDRKWYAAWFIESETGKHIGDLCFKGLADGCVEMGYGILPEYWGNGYATEALKATVDWALEQPEVNAVEAETDANNFASQKVLEKAGFDPTGKIGEEVPRFVRRNNE